MKNTRSFLAILSIYFAAHTGAIADTVILADEFNSNGGLTNLVVNVPAGQMMVIRASTLPYAKLSSGGFTYSSLLSPGALDSFDTQLQPRYLAGPCTFLYEGNGVPSYGAIFAYDLISSGGIQTIVLTNGGTIQVPAGKRMRLLDGSYPLTLAVTLTNGAVARQIRVTPRQNTSVSYGCSPEGFELAGPLTVAVGGPQSPQLLSYVTYFFASDVVQAVGESIQSPVGSIVTVEKSTDLQNWFPAFTTTEKSAPKAFYRLKVAQ